VERWQRIEEIFHEALQRDPAERESYVREACNGDSDLRREVNSLLANHREANDLESWAAAAAEGLVADRTSLHPGQRLGPYRIDSLLAVGGMGEVYRSTDTRLHRVVAIKVSASRFSERFEKEARVIASLNHANICQLYDVGPNYLVMELVEGRTLADRIRQGPLPLHEALTIARQIAEALEAAHEKGRVHRDLKPANVKITPEGVVKLLDFGLAKAAEEPLVTGNASDSPTQTISATRAGVILGTAAYMSPEQARAGVVDKRADIWAFGCVLYEMLTGKQAFQGETTSDILAAVLKEEPDLCRNPAKVQPLLRRCLVKDPKHRLRDIGDAMPMLEAAPDTAPGRSRPWPWITTAAVFAIAFCLAGGGWWRSNRAAPLHPLLQLSAELSPGSTLDSFRPGGGYQVALSPDGTRIAVVEHYGAGNYRLATRRLDQSEFAQLPGTESANMPFFSPDGQWIGFFADGKLKKIPVEGGSAVTLCDAPDPEGASWGDDGNIVAAFNQGTTGLVQIPSRGGAPTPVTKPSVERFERQLFPQVLPGSQAVLITATSGALFSGAEIDVVFIKTGERKTVLRGGFFGRCLPSGRLVYMNQNTLLTAQFDLGRLTLTAAPQPVLEDVNYARYYGAGNFDFSRTGIFVYVSSKGQVPTTSIFWLDSAGKTQPLPLTPGFYMTPRFSPDGKRLAFVMGPPDHRDLWVRELDRGATSRVTSLGRVGIFPVWTPDGENVVTNNGEALGMYWVRADGAGEAQPLTDDKTSAFAPYSFSPNGKRLAYTHRGADGYSEIWTAPIEGDREHRRLGRAALFLRSASSLTGQTAPAFSPDGHWLAYASDDAGTREVYVRPFPGPGGKTQISTGGGSVPIWSRVAKELFFLTADERIAVAGYTLTGDSFVAGKPRIWSEKRLPEVPPYSFSIDLAPDGKRFAVVLFADGTAETRPLTHVTVLQNFFNEMNQRVPAEGK
jgi:serine/threonine-protein kinase